MKACVLHRQSELRWEEFPAPKINDPHEVLVRVRRGGICGSDIHYYVEGGVGDAIRVREPIVIGHEGCGEVAAVGAAVTSVEVGDSIVMRPARPCFECRYCKRGMFTYCENMKHLGSAALLPHTHGLLAEYVVIHETQAKIIRKISPEIAAFAEPLGVAYGGAHKLGDLLGKSVLVMGAGPIGLLSAAAAKTLGAGRVTVIDVRQAPLEIAQMMGADDVCNSKTEPERVAAWKEHKGSFDCAIEASGNKYGAVDAMALTMPDGVVAQVGSFPAGAGPDNFGYFTTKGIKWHASFRFFDEFGPAVNALEQGLIDPSSLLSATFKGEDCVKAMEAAISPATMKVQIVISE
jgi:L-idonate 5-dehydrogenase